MSGCFDVIWRRYKHVREGVCVCMSRARVEAGASSFSKQKVGTGL